MALNPTTLEFLLGELERATMNSFAGITSQILRYLDVEVKDNPIFQKYEKELSK